MTLDEKYMTKSFDNEDNIECDFEMILSKAKNLKICLKTPK